MIKIYHNPACGTSTNVLAFIKEAGFDPEVILYLETPPSAAELTQLIADMKQTNAALTVWDIVRTNVPPYQAHQLEKRHLSDEELINLMVAEPLLINRPIVVTELATKLCRPSETVHEILPKK